MSEPAPEPSLREVSAKVDALILGLKWQLFATLLLASAVNYCFAVGILKFQQIFTDALPGKPLPGISLLLIHGRLCFIFFAPVWFVIGSSVLVMAKSPKIGVLGTIAVIFVIVLQILITWIGCLLPLAGM